MSLLKIDGHWIWNWTPVLTFPWGQKKYHQLYALYGDEDFFGPGGRIAWWREFCHMIGGFALTFWMVFYSLEAVAPFALVFLITGLELFQVWNNPKQKSWNFKNTMDVTFWAAGGMATLAMGLFV